VVGLSTGPPLEAAAAERLLAQALDGHPYQVLIADTIWTLSRRRAEHSLPARRRSSVGEHAERRAAVRICAGPMRLGSSLERRRAAAPVAGHPGSGKRLITLLDVEFSGVPSNEREAAVLTVRDTFAAARLSDEALFHADLDSRLVERQVWPAAGPILRNAVLSEGGEEIYRLVLRECCSYLVEVVTTLPKFSSGALTELLRRETAVLDTLSRVLDRLPERRGLDDFAADYRRAVVNKLDRMELLGVTLADANRRYPLSIAYIDLTVLTVLKRARRGDGLLVIRSGQDADDPFAGAGGLRPESALSRTRRALVIGQAGSGKTTLLRWLAVRSALGDFNGSLTGWHGTVPFFIPLRRYVNRAPCPPRRSSRWGPAGTWPTRCPTAGSMDCCATGGRWSCWTGSMRCPRDSESTCGAGSRT